MATKIGINGFGRIGRCILRALVERNVTFPTGIDVVLVDPEGRVACLPRSTRIALED